MIKNLLPQNLFGRALLILILPTVLIQLGTAYIFFERHWDNISRHLSNALAGEVALLVNQVAHGDDMRRKELYALADGLMGIQMRLTSPPPEKLSVTKKDPLLDDLRRSLQKHLKHPFSLSLNEDEGMIRIRVLLDDSLMTLDISVKRISSRTTQIFIIWLVGASLILMIIATMFLRNQIRPITRLAEAAEHFGKGQEAPGFRPQGAREVRQASKAFIDMRERIQRQIKSRTEMLAGISHDLRTPMSRMKLSLAMMKDSPEVKELQDDVVEMEKMVEEYLDFVRGGDGEEAVNTPLTTWLTAITDDYARQNKPVTLTSPEQEIDVTLRPYAMRRALVNLIENALRYGKCCEISVKIMERQLRIYMDDAGPGIPADQHALVFQPFKRLDPSRNIETGGVGLGLTIARDIVQMHGGQIKLDTSPLGGLRVEVILPR